MNKYPEVNTTGVIVQYYVDNFDKASVQVEVRYNDLRDPDSKILGQNVSAQVTFTIVDPVSNSIYSDAVISLIAKKSGYESYLFHHASNLESMKKFNITGDERLGKFYFKASEILKEFKFPVNEVKSDK